MRKEYNDIVGGDDGESVVAKFHKNYNILSARLANRILERKNEQDFRKREAETLKSIREKESNFEL